MKNQQPYASIAAMGKNLSAVAARHIERAFRYVLRGPNVVSERRFVRLITGDPHPFGNFAILAESTDLAGTQAASEPLLNCAAASAVLFTGPVAAEVDAWLRGRGFELHGGMPAMAVEIDSLRPTGLPAGYSLTRVGSGPESDEWAEAFSVGYELPRSVGEAFSPNAVCATTAADAPIQYFAIRRTGRIVCTSFVYLDDGVAGIYCVATIAEERGQGLGAHATAEPLRQARELGCRVGVLQSSPAGHSVYRKLGFADVGDVPMYVRIPE